MSIVETVVMIAKRLLPIIYGFGLSGGRLTLIIKDMRKTATIRTKLTITNTSLNLLIPIKNKSKLKNRSFLSIQFIREW
jgi:hypothetical protein